MILISKKRIGIILSCIFISLFAFAFQIANNQNSSDIAKNETSVETVATPVSGKTIVVDARSSEFQMRGIKC